MLKTNSINTSRLKKTLINFKKKIYKANISVKSLIFKLFFREALGGPGPLYRGLGRPYAAPGPYTGA